MIGKKIASLLLIALSAALTICALALASGNPTIEGRGITEARDVPNHPQAEFLPVMLRLGGFVPREISRPAGEYVLSVNNQSGVPEVELRLQRENGERVHEAKVLRRKPYWRQLVRLTPGTYLITEASHPGWVCRITVTAR
jgi:hypothetical protein